MKFPLCLLLLTALAFTTHVPAQNRKKPKLKDFGQSLKKLKWDPERNTVIDNSERTVNTPEEDDVVRIETTLVSCSVLVVDKAGRTILGLKQDDFEITEDDAPHQVGHFVLGDSTKLARSIVLIIDYSGSQLPFIANSVEAAKVLVDKLSPADQMAIVTDDVELLIGFTSDKDKLKKKLDSLLEKNKGNAGRFPYGSFGRSLQYSALMATLKEAFDDEDERPILIFQTDGDQALYLRNPIILPRVPAGLPPAQKAEVRKSAESLARGQREPKTEFSLDDVYREVEKSRATIYTVIPGTKLIDLPAEEQVLRFRVDDQTRNEAWMSKFDSDTKAFVKKGLDKREKLYTREMWQMLTEDAVKIQSALAVLAPISGGWTEFLERPEQAAAIYSRIFDDISQRYIVGYYPKNKNHDSKRREISVAVKGHPEYTVLGKRWYHTQAR